MARVGPEAVVTSKLEAFAGVIKLLAGGWKP